MQKAFRDIEEPVTLRTFNYLCHVNSWSGQFHHILTRGHLHTALCADTASQSALTPQSPQGFTHLKSRQDCWEAHSPSDSHS